MSVPVPRHKEIDDSLAKTLFAGTRARARQGLVAEMRQMFRAIAKRDGRWWFVHVPQEQGLYTQVRRLDQAEPMIREVIGLMRGMPEDAFDVVVEPQMDSLGDLQATIEEALRARQDGRRGSGGIVDGHAPRSPRGPQRRLHGA